MQVNSENKIKSRKYNLINRSKLYDLSGQKFNKLTVIKFLYYGKLYDKGKRRGFYLCKCDCGKEIILPGIKIKNGGNKSCGCINTPKYNIDEKYFEKIDSEAKAYFLGFLYTDGTVSKDKETNKRVQMSLSTKDKYILEEFKKELRTTKPLQLTKRNARKIGDITIKKSEIITMNISNVKIRKDLINLGLIPQKTKKMTFPNNKILSDKFLRHFIRGVYDGDGTIAKSGNSVSCNITSGSHNFIKVLSKILKSKFKIESSIIFYSRKSKFDKSKIHEYWVLNIKCKNSKINQNSSNHQLFFQTLYKNCSNNFYLKRKKEKFIEIYNF